MYLHVVPELQGLVNSSLGHLSRRRCFTRVTIKARGGEDLRNPDYLTRSDTDTHQHLLTSETSLENMVDRIVRMRASPAAGVGGMFATGVGLDEVVRTAAMVPSLIKKQNVSMTRPYSPLC